MQWTSSKPRRKGAVGKHNNAWRKDQDIIALSNPAAHERSRRALSDLYFGKVTEVAVSESRHGFVSKYLVQRRQPVKVQLRTESGEVLLTRALPSQWLSLLIGLTSPNRFWLQTQGSQSATKSNQTVSGSLACFGGSNYTLHLEHETRSKLGFLAMGWDNKLELQRSKNRRELQISSGPYLHCKHCKIAAAIESDGLKQTSCVFRVGQSLGAQKRIPNRTGTGQFNKIRAQRPARQQPAKRSTRDYSGIERRTACKPQQSRAQTVSHRQKEFRNSSKSPAKEDPGMLAGSWSVWFPLDQKSLLKSRMNVTLTLPAGCKVIATVNSPGIQGRKPVDSQIQLTKKVLQNKLVKFMAKGQKDALRSATIALTSTKKNVNWIASIQSDATDRLAVSFNSGEPVCTIRHVEENLVDSMRCNLSFRTARRNASRSCQFKVSTSF